MSERLAAAEAALKAGRRDEAIDHLTAMIADDPNQPAKIYTALLIQLYQANRYEEGETLAARAMERHPRDVPIANLRGVLLRRLHRYAEAREVLEGAVRLDPRQEGPLSNLCNVLLDMGEHAKAETGFLKLLRQSPRNAEFQRLLGRALRMQGKTEQALVRFRQAVAIKKDLIEGWLDLAATLSELQRSKLAYEAIDKGLAANPDTPRLIEANAMLMRREGRLSVAEAYLQSLLPRHGDAAWLQYQLGLTVADQDRIRGNAYFQRAADLEPDNFDYLLSLVESLERTRSGDEGGNIEQAYQLAKAALARGVEVSGPGPKKVLLELFERVADYDALAALGDFRSIGRGWAESGRHTALFKQLALVRDEDDRQELLEQHQIWGRDVERQAAAAPIRRPKPRAPDGRIRLGLVSSDLRRHPVGYFAMPLFEAVDPRFDLYAYSYNQGAEDDVQKFMASKCKAFRWTLEVSARDAAQLIADDELDILIELGGSTFMNKLEVMAYKPAPRQASWLGYPHSAGLSTIDYLVVDPYVMPERPGLILEKPLMLANAWYPLGAFHFRAEPAAAAEPPVARNGYVTFGTANNPQKYTLRVIQTWARVLRETPGSRFLFVRPEGSAASFRQNLRAIFEAGGVAGERVEFEAVRGAHLPHYNRIDITLDCFPQTGGTTTCESLWMGAPCVTLVGDSVFERLSYSTLMNLGLPELCARSLDDYVATAVKLASDPARIAELRAGLRQRMQQSPLGQTQAWARDFYEAVARTVAG